jgi:hypothetical protein
LWCCAVSRGNIWPLWGLGAIWAVSDGIVVICRLIEPKLSTLRC